ncbi:MAG: hypothetical protein WBZ36_27590 [Candidatus Nitrosopolaris sp.]
MRFQGEIRHHRNRLTILSSKTSESGHIRLFFLFAYLYTKGFDSILDGKNTVYLMVLPIVLLTTFPFVYVTSHPPAYDHGYQAGYDNETTAFACGIKGTLLNGTIVIMD